MESDDRDSIWKMGNNTWLYHYIILSFYRAAFNSPVNAAVVTRLVKEVQKAHTIKGKCKYLTVKYLYVAAVYTYYRSLSQENRLKLSGKHSDPRRRRERLLRV